MHTPELYEIRIAGHLGVIWQARFEGLSMQLDPGGETVLSGTLDQAALHGVLIRIRDLGAELISVNRTGRDASTATDPGRAPTTQVGGKTAMDKMITLDSGKISGIAADGYQYYLGIPFAAPPVGDQRWKPPQPVEPWSGVKECTEFGPACPQLPNPALKIDRMDEDCLYLNVWTPASRQEDRLPVMVWIYGGGYQYGSASEIQYGGASLAKKGVVVVTVNYRVGTFGFLSHPQLAAESPQGSTGHCGILDNIAALEWVQRNIAAFGGDPSRVTIFGESAGGNSVVALTQSPPAKGLFHRAIAQSPAMVSSMTIFGGPRDPEAVRRDMEAIGQALAAILGCTEATDVLACMRAKTLEEILAALAAHPELAGGPIGDDIVVSKAYFSPLEERHWHDVPLIIGNNANELAHFAPPPSVVPPEMMAGFLQMFQPWESYIQRTFGEQADRLLALYPADTPADVLPALDKLGTDLMACYCRSVTASRLQQLSSPTYVYRFTQVPDWEHSETMGAFHGLEIGYVFGGPRMFGMEQIEYEAEDRALSEMMMDYWTAFAATGDPNGPGRPHWPVYDPASDEHLELGSEVTVKSGLVREICDLLP
jgi:para-nitrobenzyl esterase